MIGTDDLSAPGTGGFAGRAGLRRAALFVLAPVVLYALARPVVGSDAVALGIAAAPALGYSLLRALRRHDLDPLALVSVLGLGAACLVSALTGGSSLPLKVHEALVTFAIGAALLVAPLVGRPFPLARLVRVPGAQAHIDTALGVLVGGFLVVHALLHVVLAVELSTSSYVVVSRLVNWGTVAVGAGALSGYLRRYR